MTALWRRNDSERKEKNTENCGWSAILTASGFGMANIDIINTLFLLPHMSDCYSTDHLTTSGMPYTAPPIQEHYKEEKNNLINKELSNNRRLNGLLLCNWMGSCSIGFKINSFFIVFLASKNWTKFLWPCCTCCHSEEDKIFPKINSKKHNKHRLNSNRANSSIQKL